MRQIPPGNAREFDPAPAPQRAHELRFILSKVRQAQQRNFEPRILALHRGLPERRIATEGIEHEFAGGEHARGALPQRVLATPDRCGHAGRAFRE